MWEEPELAMQTALPLFNKIALVNAMPGLTQLSTYSQSIRRTDLPRLRRISFDRLSEVAESIDDLFMAYETLHENDSSSTDKNTVAVGVFYFEEQDESMVDQW